MRKLLALACSLALVLLGSAVAGAIEAPKVTVGAGYLFGNASLEPEGATLEYADKGVVLTADATVAGPFGIMLSYSSLTGSDFKMGDVEMAGWESEATRTDLLATYTPSFGQGGLRFFAGYSTTEESLTMTPWPQTTISVKGPLVGGTLALPAGEKLILSGFAGYGVGMTWKMTQSFDSQDGDASLLTYRLAASYLLTSNVALEAGYIGNDYTLKPSAGEGAEDIKESVSGFFVGARALF